jgi:hypothetical protein
MAALRGIGGVAPGTAYGRDASGTEQRVARVRAFRVGVCGSVSTHLDEV